MTGRPATGHNTDGPRFPALRQGPIKAGLPFSPLAPIPGNNQDVLPSVREMNISLSLS
jgi:hypothetical protein